jgi:hypothetical protein
VVFLAWLEPDSRVAHHAQPHPLNFFAFFARDGAVGSRGHPTEGRQEEAERSSDHGTDGEDCDGSHGEPIAAIVEDAPPTYGVATKPQRDALMCRDIFPVLHRDIEPSPAGQARCCERRFTFAGTVHPGPFLSHGRASEKPSGNFLRPGCFGQ